MSSAVAPMSPSHFGPGIQKDPENNQKVSDVNLLGVTAIIKSMWVFLPKVSRFSVYLIFFLALMFSRFNNSNNEIHSFIILFNYSFSTTF